MSPSIHLLRPHEDNTIGDLVRYEEGAPSEASSEMAVLKLRKKLLLHSKRNKSVDRYQGDQEDRTYLGYLWGRALFDAKNH